MRNFTRRLTRIVSAGALAIWLAACGSQGPSIKERADEAATRKKQNKEREEFAKSLPPTDAKPIFKP